MPRKQVDQKIKDRVANRLKEAMNAKGLNGRALSKLSGVSEVDISSYRNARYLPQQDKLFMLALALGVSPTWLWGTEDEKEDDNEFEFLWLNLNEEHQAQVKEYMRFLLLQEVKGAKE